MVENKLLLNSTVEEFIEALRQGLGLAMSDNEQNDPPLVKKQFVYGLKGLCQLLGCSLSTASRIKKSGVLDPAISQHGKIIVFDANLVIELLKVQKKFSRGIRSGYKK